MNKTINELSTKLSSHPLYSKLTTPQNIKTFMEYHSFAVFDFMSLLKSLQKTITLSSLPWKPSIYSSEVVRFVNEIVLGEESDLDENQNPTSHFDLYIKAMQEVGANTTPVLEFIHSISPGEYSVKKLPHGVSEFVDYNLRLALDGDVVEVAGAFLYGREKLVPMMFETIVKVLGDNKMNCPSLMFYLKRHIELDGESHGPMAEKCLKALCGDDESKWDKAHKASLRSLELRSKLWDACLLKMN